MQAKATYRECLKSFMIICEPCMHGHPCQMDSACVTIALYHFCNIDQMALYST